MIAGSMTGSFSSFGELAINLENKVGIVGSWALGIGLFAAGFSSSHLLHLGIMIASTVLGSENKNAIRVVWMLVVLLTRFSIWC